MTISDTEHDQHLRRGIRLEWMTTGWNLMEVVVTVSLGVAANSLALIAFGLDSLIEVFASTVVIWHLKAGRDPAPARTRLALRLIAAAFGVLAAYLSFAAVRSLLAGDRPEDSFLGIAYLAVTAAVMFTLAAAKRRIARTIDSGPLAAEAAMTTLDGFLCLGILTALAANAVLGWWWADPLAALGVAAFATREAFESLAEARTTFDDEPVPEPDA